MILRYKVASLAVISFIGVSAVSAQTPAPAPRAESKAFTMVFGGGSYLGVQTENVTKENASKYNLTEPRGVAVTKVLENSPAASAGLRDGDVIVRFDGEEVKSVAKLTRMISEVAPDQKARVTILRGGREQEITVTMGKREMPEFRAFGGTPNGVFTLPSPGEIPFMRIDPNNLPKGLEKFEMRNLPEGEVLYFGNTGRKLGVVTTPLTKQLGEYFGSADGKGLLVEEVRENSAAAKAGLRAGDVILEVDGASLENQSDLIRALNKKTEGDVTLTILRDKQRLTLRATPEGKKENQVFPQSNTTF